MIRQVDLLVIGGGSAGLCAAMRAKREGVENILVIERTDKLGGILRQCIHNGFGLHYYGEDLTGVEFAQRCAKEAEESGIRYMLNTFVIHVGRDLTATAVSPEEGLVKIQAKAIILAMGCRERSRGALLIPGWRSAGIFTAGTAQRYLNIEGYLPGEKIVILGSGDIGLIMARQFTVEGAEVKRVVEIMPYSSGLARNIKQCLEDFDIPINYNSTVIDIKGRKRVEAVVVAQVDKDRKPIPGTEEEISCDTLIISAGLIPENELSIEAGVELSGATKGAVVDDTFETSVPGIFACGNVLHVHDLVDHVAEEGEEAGSKAAAYLLGNDADYNRSAAVSLLDGKDVMGVVPQFVRRTGEDHVRVTFRPRRVIHHCEVVFRSGEGVLFRQKKAVVRPGEMQTIRLPRKAVAEYDAVTVSIEEVQQ